MRFFIEAENYDYSQLAQSPLTSAISVGDTTINIQNVSGFQVGKFLVMGLLGTEKTEVKAISSIGVNSITLSSGASFAHDLGGVLHMTHYDTVQLWSATVVDGLEPTDGAYSMFEEKLIDFENITTLFEDNSGTTDKRYKVIFKNSVDASSTTLADSYAVKGEEVSDYCSVAYVKELLKVNTDDYLISRLIRAASDFIDSRCNRYPIGTRLSYHNVTEVLDTEARVTTYFPVNTPIIAVNNVDVMLNGSVEYNYTKHVFNYKEYLKFNTNTSTTSVFYNQNVLFQTRNQGLKLDMQVGFFDNSSIPSDLKYICAKLAIHEYKKYTANQSLQLKAKTIGRFRLEYDTTALAKAGVMDIDSVLSKYQKISMSTL